MITIVDYGMGNLRSVSKAIEHLGAPCTISSTAKALEKAQKIILPGVGAFGDAMKELKRLKLIEPIRQQAVEGKKILGVCLGLQLFFEKSEENPGIKGLGLIPGKILRFRSQQIKIPHMGWNDLKFRKEHPLLKGVPDHSYFYFVHSYYAKPDSTAAILASCQYGTETFPAIVGIKNLFATQFHPEKSQEAGLKILENFIAW